MQTKRSKTGFAGEFFIYSQLIKEGKNCFITLGNAKSVDLIIINNERKAFYIDVKSTSTPMKNTHKHLEYDTNNGLLSRWQLSMSKFWNTHEKNHNKKSEDYPDFYIFHNSHNPFQNIIVTSGELCKIMHRRIDDYLRLNNKTELAENQLGIWDVCDFCFQEYREYNNWNKLP